MQHNINVFDVGRALLCCEDKLRQRPEGVAGEAFLITGKSKAWSFRVSERASNQQKTKSFYYTCQEYRRVTRYFAGRWLGFVPVSAALMLLTAHVTEFFFLCSFSSHFHLFLRSPVDKSQCATIVCDWCVLHQNRFLAGHKDASRICYSFSQAPWTRLPVT